MAEKKQFREYMTEDLIVFWNLSHCSHSGKCTDLLPKAFDMNRRPWVCLEGVDTLDIIRVIDKCPSGALRYELTENSKIDPDLAKGPGWIGYKVSEPSIVQIRMVKDGPLLVKGPARVSDSDGNIIRECESMVLCRCGLTKNPPFCDGSHRNKEEVFGLERRMDAALQEAQQEAAENPTRYNFDEVSSDLRKKLVSKVDKTNGR